MLIGLSTPWRHDAVTASMALTSSWDTTAILWDLEAAKPLRTFRGHTGTITSVALSSDGKRAVTGSADRTARLWDAESATTLQTFKGLGDFVRSVAINEDVSRILTLAGADRWPDVGPGVAILWDVTTGKALLKPSKGKAITSSLQR